MSVEQLLAEKYAKLQEKRISHGMTIVTNDELNTHNPDNPVLIAVPEVDFPVYKKQGYRKYTAPVSAPLEAKRSKKEVGNELDTKE